MEKAKPKKQKKQIVAAGEESKPVEKAEAKPDNKPVAKEQKPAKKKEEKKVYKAKETAQSAA